MVKVPNGHYAVEVDGVTKFYKVNTPVQGKWKGFTFVEVQASDDFWPLRDRAARARVLELIGSNVRAALVLYGLRLGRCGVCGRTLTDEDSRSRGIGPVCEGKF